jgi:hypothetical protein
VGEGGRQSETQAALLPTTRGLFVKPNNWAPIAQDGVDFCRTGWAHLQESRIWGEPLYFLAQGAHVGPAALYFLALAGLPTARERLIP